MLVKLIVFHGDDGVDEISRQLSIGNGLPVLDIDLPKNFVVAIEDDAGRFHLFELREVERGGFPTEGFGEGENVNAESDEKDERGPDRHVEFRFGKPTAMEI